MTVGLTSMLRPVPTYVPPQLPVYQSTVTPSSVVAESVAELPLQMVAGEADVLSGADGNSQTFTSSKKTLHCFVPLLARFIHDHGSTSLCRRVCLVSGGSMCMEAGFHGRTNDTFSVCAQLACTGVNNRLH